MSILKNEIPILEFDAEQNAVIDSTHENLDIELPPKCVFAFLCLTQSMCFRYKTYVNFMKSLFIKYVAYATPYKGINFFTG